MIVQERDVHFNVNNVLIAHWNRMFLGIYVFEWEICSMSLFLGIIICVG